MRYNILKIAYIVIWNNLNTKRGGGQRSTMVSTLASGPWFDSQFSRNVWCCWGQSAWKEIGPAAWKCWSNTSSTGEDNAVQLWYWEERSLVVIGTILQWKLSNGIFFIFCRGRFYLSLLTSSSSVSIWVPSLRTVLNWQVRSLPDSTLSNFNRQCSYRLAKWCI